MKRAIALLALALLLAGPSFSQEDTGQATTDAEGVVAPNDTVGLAQVSEVPAVCNELIGGINCPQAPAAAPVDGAQTGAASPAAGETGGKGWWDWITGK